MGRPKKPFKMNVTVELVYELPWERDARLAALNKFPAASFSPLRRTQAVTNQEMQEGAALFRTAPSLANWLRA